MILLSTKNAAKAYREKIEAEAPLDLSVVAIGFNAFEGGYRTRFPLAQTDERTYTVSMTLDEARMLRDELVRAVERLEHYKAEREETGADKFDARIKL